MGVFIFYIGALSSYAHAYNMLIDIYTYQVAHFYIHPDSWVGQLLQYSYQSLVNIITYAHPYITEQSQWIQDNSYF